MTSVCTVEEMREWERITIERGTEVSQLMLRAGMALADVMLTDPRAQSPVVILAGPGNNGGDALICAHRLAESGESVRIVLWRRDETSFPGLPPGVAHIVASEDSLDEILRWCLQSKTIVDGLLGTGASRPPAGVLAELIRTVEQCRTGSHHSYVIAADLPTGIDADSGKVETVAIRADRTVAFGAIKAGTLCFPAAEHAGQTTVARIGLVEDARPAGRLIDNALVTRLLPERSVDSNKGSFGTIVILGGSEQFVGAPVLTAKAAMRVGAGLVRLAVPRSIYSIVATKLDEAVFEPLSDGDGAICQDAVESIERTLTRARAFVIGPGLSQRGEAPKVVLDILERLSALQSKLSIVVDADALNALSQSDYWWKKLPQWCVLTPHPGEMARLAGVGVAAIQNDRVRVTREMAARWQQIVVLKGAHTVVALPDRRWFISTIATPALAVAGSGDVLAGTIGGLVAQDITPWNAAVAGVWLHGMAGKIIEHDIGMAGGTPNDIAMALPQALRHVREAISERSFQARFVDP
ncbi:MAG: NAD(P)H-hydrate dehydratase [Chloroflexi bacterium]|nr:NAD(P)H-hydrate dehydratase [Chloroflexota bacterium]